MSFRSCVLFVVVCFFALTCVAIASENKNLLTNGQFAPGEDATLPSDWKVSQSDQRTSLDDRQTPPDVPQSLRIDIRSRQSGMGQIIQRFEPFQPRTTYRFSAMVRSTAPRLGVIQVKLYKDRKELKRISSDRSTSEWQRVAIDFSSEDADKIELLLRYFADKPEHMDQTIWFADAQMIELPPPELTKVATVGTYRSLSVTADYQGGANDSYACRLSYRPAGQTQWREGMDLVCYTPEQQFRGSLLMLEPNCRYEISCRLVDLQTGQSQTPITTTGQTWPEDVPIGEVRHLPEMTDKTLWITDRGKPDAWILYCPAPGATATIDAGHKEDCALRIDQAAYVIVQNVAVRGGYKDCIRISRSNHIHISRCDIADWSEAGTRKEDLEQGLYVDATGRVINFRAGVRVSDGSTQVVVENNYIHHPRGTANSWKYGHPAGPQGVILDRTGGNNVVRNNDIVGSEEHWWNDGIESIRNSNVDGGPHRDTDIYGNILTFQNDDGIELDGGQINVRCFGNWIDKALCGVSCAPNRRGPSYVFRNLILLTGDEHFQTGAGFKMGGDRYSDPGLSILLHNTVYSHRSGLTAGHYGKGPTPIRTRNNILSGPRGNTGGNKYRHGSGADFAYDLVPPDSIATDAPWQIDHVLIDRPKYVDVSTGDFRLAEGSPGIDAGVRLPTLNDDFAGDGPDLGAFERGRDENPVFPLRPGRMGALPLRQTVDYVSGEPTAAEVKILVLTEAGTHWTAHVNSPWLQCTPSEGVTSDTAQTVHISLRGSDHAVRLHRGAVTFRTDTGMNRTVMVDFRVLPQPFVSIPLEVESGEISGQMRKVDDPAASGGTYLDTTEWSTGSVSFTVDIPVAGTYFVTGRTLVPGPADEAGVHDSFEISVDGGERLRWDLDRSAPDQWLWILASPERKPPHPFKLTAGKHKITIHSRERLARIDRIVVTNAPYAEP